MRLFLAIDIPDAIQDQVSELVCPELEQVRWISCQQLHITLVFIGEQPQHRLDEIIEATAETNFEPFPLKLSKIGHFKSGIIWLGVEESEPLKRLQKSLSHKIRSLGIELEQRKFIPHLTLGRCKQLTPEILSKVSTQGLGFETGFNVEAFQLKSSILKANGAEYVTEGEFLPD
ncbi:RNA 2',3'-cyclic phosphodiesterase [Neptuniibacter caesariensis]|uniref:RNA 2',3'-cyclic phosphodiesterase n=1 Tax=Neptuniibacter caesariensis TaxID=207954 RepID=A0A7U8C587_NEPCE|nr:RNA 2',3'-cyclic phosphodiesterase [Neptuniibacter caesariensis]EAR61772.1 2',5' RNA ligase [Neptuniibacter caesariensis]